MAADISGIFPDRARHKRLQEPLPWRPPCEPSEPFFSCRGLSKLIQLLPPARAHPGGEKARGPPQLLPFAPITYTTHHCDGWGGGGVGTLQHPTLQANPCHFHLIHTLTPMAFAWEQVTLGILKGPGLGDSLLP